MTEVAGERYALEVIAAAKVEVAKVCAALPTPTDERERVVDLQVLTHTQLSPEHKRLLRADVDRVAQPAQACVQTYLLPPDPWLADSAPGFSVAATMAEPVPDPETARGSARLDQRALLTLTSGTLTVSYLLTPAEGWLSVRRKQDGDDAHTDILLPVALRGVSRAVLVELRYRGEDLELRAAAEKDTSRPTVLLDGRPLSTVSSRSAGRLSFVQDDQRTDLDFLLAGWRDDELARSTGRAEGVGETPYLTTVVIGTERGELRIDPPEVGVRPEERRFRVLAPQFAEGEMAVRTEVLYSTATSVGEGFDEQRWHVKLFRTATPQHACYLRETFARQAESVREVILDGGRSPRQPPWGIAPVHVLDPADDLVNPIAEPTRLGVAPRSDVVDGRFGEWFGVGDGAWSDCFVVVVSPLLGKANVESSPSGPALLHLTRFRIMAQALDLAHDRGIAHCDLKPDNYRKQGGDYVLVDGDSVTALDSAPRRVSYTVPYASADMLQLNPPDRDGERVLRAEHLVAHDQFGFGLLVLGAVVGKAWLGDTTSGAPGSRTIDKPELLRDALTRKWPDDQRWAALTELLSQPFGAARAQEGWTCEKWLERVIAQANAPVQNAGLSTGSVYRGPHAAAVASIRAAITADTPNPANAVAVVDRAVAAEAEHTRKQARLHTALGVGSVGLIVLGVALVDLARSLGWLP